MSIDFESEYGVNAGYVQGLHEQWLANSASVDASWAKIFEHEDPEGAAASLARAAAAVPTPPAPTAPDEDPELERLTGVSRLIVKNMTASLEVPTATTVRTLPVKLLDENRRLINEHMEVRALGKASYTHIVAFAMIRALAEMPRVQSAFVDIEGVPHRRTPEHVNFGLAIDVPGAKGRMLVVPKIPAAETLSFKEFYRAYEELVARGRAGELASEDFADCTVTLTNPGGFGTSMSVPRLMAGQGLILAIGSIGVPPEVRGMSAGNLAANAIGPVMTVTATYDHRVIQGAESGLLLQRIDRLLAGEEDFYDTIFHALRIPWSPVRFASDVELEASERGRIDQRSKVWQLVNAYRSRGCRLADLDPLEYRPDPIESLDPATYGFTVWDLERSFSSGDLSREPTITLRQILSKLRRAYCRRWTVEYMHIVDRDRKLWVREHVEDPEHAAVIDHDDRLRIMRQLSAAENFERFLHGTYVGNKRFSLEGGDTMIPALAALIDRAAESGVERVVIGMAHRGRLNVLANIMGKNHEQIFREFEGVLLPLSVEGSGDVKYHLGQRGTYKTASGKEVEVVLSANPSHLEAVDPVVCGMARAYQDLLGDVERRKVLAVQIHGDAAFAGQGVVTETLNLSQLEGYTNGGTVHLVINNQIGFTASPKDTRSAYYCTDAAKGIQAPVLHANGDNPEAVVRAVQIAVDYQGRFGADAVVDMVCYRRWGHNEGDEPAYTQPVLYAKIRNHPTVSESYKQLLLRRGNLTEAEAQVIFDEASAELSAALESFRSKRPAETAELPLLEIVDVTMDEPEDYTKAPSPETGVPSDELVGFIDRLNAMPTGHVTHPNLLRQLRRRESMVRGELDLDWGAAEALAYATLISEGVQIRLSGQDSGRGTFSHRHSVIRHQETDVDHVPLASLAAELGTGGYEVHDSPLSEEAVLGFEYGYALVRPDALVIWEAQFGDFANGAQIQFDQFIASGEAKWKQIAGLVMLLPHGFDGQGPEHSSARPERYLQLCSAGNMTVTNPSTAAQFFHLMRRQGQAGLRHEARPLIVFTPKSMLRDKRAASPVEALTEGGFQELCVTGTLVTAKRVILCSGKVRHDLVDKREARDDKESFAIVSLEQLYPLPRPALLELFEAAPDAEWIWCQEEPRNMGAWSFVLQRFLDLERRLRYVGRAETSSPATGSYHRHAAEQEWLLGQAFA